MKEYFYLQALNPVNDNLVEQHYCEDEILNLRLFLVLFKSSLI